MALAASASLGLGGEERAHTRARRAWEGIVGWFVDRRDQPCQATLLGERTNRAIRDLAVLLERVLEATAGGVSRATQLELLAEWVLACPDDTHATALIGAFSGICAARHFGAPDDDPEATAPNTSWWEASPAPVDMTLRKRGKPASPGRPGAIDDRRKDREILRLRQARRRQQQARASEAMVDALQQARPLDEMELSVLLRLLSRALHSRAAASTSARTTHGRLRLRLVPAEDGTVVPTCRGTLVLEGLHLAVERSSDPEAGPRRAP